MPDNIFDGARQNRILAALLPEEYARLADDLEFVSLTAGQTILESGDDLTSVYFPTTCIFSLISSLKDGSSVELAMTGNDGLIGIPLVLGGDTANYRIVVQHAGGAYRLRAELMSWELNQGGNLRRMSLCYTQALMTEMAQSVLCNRHHTVDQQLCRWLLRNLDQISGMQPDAAPAAQGALERIIVLLRNRSGNDLSLYKPNTLLRRIERRMALLQIAAIDDYVGRLHDKPQELDLLFKELLIGVTSFFRDPPVWDYLRDVALPALFARHPGGQTLRAWVPACSTGEEAYSLAMVFREALDNTRPPGPFSLQIYATDLDPDAVDRARRACYPANIAADVTPERLARHFVAEDDGYRLNRELREMVIFAPHNLISDPPFTKLDILTCRNLLIYFGQALQKKVLPLFHYALNRDGILVLGSAETIGGFGTLFSPLDKKTHVFRRTQHRNQSSRLDFPTRTPTGPASTDGSQPHFRDNLEYLTDVKAPSGSRRPHKQLASERESAQLREALQISRQEMQAYLAEAESANEERQTINAELQPKVDDLTWARNDMTKLLNSTEIATVFLDSEMRLRRLTTHATHLFKFIPGDVGRPLSDIVTDLDYPGLQGDASAVLTTLIDCEKQVSTGDGRWFRVRIMPYRTQDNVIDGVVLTFIDITAIKQLEAKLRKRETRRDH